MIHFRNVFGRLSKTVPIETVQVLENELTSNVLEDVRLIKRETSISRKEAAQSMREIRRLVTELHKVTNDIQHEARERNGT